MQRPNEILKLSSCFICRTRKVKCDRAKPSCGRCLQNNERCLYTGKQKPGPQPGSSQELQNRVAQLEQGLESLSRRFEQLHQSYLSPPTKQPEHGTSLDSDYPGNDQTVSRANSGWTKTLSAEGLPPHHQLCALVDLYFKHVNTWCPLLNREAIFTTLQTYSALEESSLILLHALVAISLRFSKDPCHTIEMRKQYRDVSKRRVQLFCLVNSNIRSLQALVILTIDVLGTSGVVEGMNMLALLAQNISHLDLNIERRFHLSLSPHSPAGITQNSLPPYPESWMEDEERRRLFWVVYSMDRYNMACTTCDFQVREKNVNRQLPCRYDLWSENQPVETRWYGTGEDEAFTLKVNSPANMGSFSHLCELMRILTRIHEFATAPLDYHSKNDVERWKASYNALDCQLTSWLNNLPGEYAQVSQFCHSDAKSQISNWIILQAGFVLTAIRLHSTAGYPPIASEILKPSYSAMQKCLTAAASLMSIAEDVVNNNMLDFLGPLFAGALWVTARLLLVHASIAEHRLDPNIYFFIATLEKIGKNWDVAKVFARMLQCILSDPEGVGVTKSISRLRRSAFDLHVIMAQQRSSVLHECLMTELSSNTLEYLGVFDSFNYPRPPSTAYEVADSGDIINTGGFPNVDFPYPEPDLDWLIAP